MNECQIVEKNLLDLDLTTKDMKNLKKVLRSLGRATRTPNHKKTHTIIREERGNNKQVGSQIQSNPQKGCKI